MRSEYGKNLQLEDADPGALDVSGYLFTLLLETPICRSDTICCRRAFLAFIACYCATLAALVGCLLGANAWV